MYIYLRTSCDATLSGRCKLEHRAWIISTHGPLDSRPGSASVAGLPGRNAAISTHGPLHSRPGPASALDFRGGKQQPQQPSSPSYSAAASKRQ